MRRKTLVAAVFLWLVTASTASAAPRITIGPVRNDPKAAIPAQLARALCATYQCVLWPDVSTKGQVDFAKVRAAGVGGVLSGSVTRAGAGATLTLGLLTTSTTPARSWTFPLTANGILQADTVTRLEKELGAALQSAAPPPAPAAGAPAAAAAAVAATQVVLPPARPSQVQSVPAAAPEPALFAPAPAPSSAAKGGSSAAAAAEPAPGRWILAGELGLFFMQRKLTYSGVTPSTGTLLSFDASSITGPALRVELFPAARGDSRALGGLGLFGAYATSIGLKTLAPTGEERPTTFSRLQLGAAWRSPSLGELVVLVPRLSWQALRLTVSPPIDGLPDADLSGVEVGLDLEMALGGRVVLLAGAGWVKWLSARELIDGSPLYFPSDRASALDAQLGVDVRVWRFISLRLVGEYLATSYLLQADPGGPYQATGAQDRILGARALVRGTW